MKKTLLGLALLASFGVSAAPITAPEAGKEYTIQNGAGLYMTAESSSLKIYDLDASNAAQRFEFVPVEGSTELYNIKMSNGLYVGTDGNWTVNFKEDPADTKAQVKITPSTVDAECVTLTFPGVKTSVGLGCDNAAAGSTVYTDKPDDKDFRRWKIALAPEPVSVTAPAADKYYRIRHVSGMYLTNSGWGSTVADKADDNSQIMQFVPVEGKEGVYNIRRANTGMFIGSNNKWSTTAISRNIPLSQYKVALSTDGHLVTLQNMGMAEAKSFLGTDDYTKDKNVYTDKQEGKDGQHITWFIEEAALYVAPLNAADYADRTNLIANGDFEAAGYAQEQKDGQLTLSELPEWTLEQAGWGGAVAIMADGTNHYVACQGYGDNSWTLDVAVKQIVNVTAGREHALFFDYMLGKGGNCSWGYEIKDGNNTLASYRSEKAVEEWTPMAVRFTPTSDNVTVRLFLTNNKKDWWRDNKTAYFDNVRVYDIAPVDHYADQPALPATDPRANAYDGYRLVFAEEFSTDGTPDHDIWNFEEGFKRNNEDQYYNGDKNCYIQDGVLVIEGKYVLDEKIKNPKYDKYNTGWPSRIGRYLTWTSGSMQSKGSWNSGYTWNYGIYEVRAKVPQHVGSWPAIWSTGMQYEWPYGGEIDIMEYYGNRIHANVCWGDGKRWAGHWNSATVHDNELGAGWGDEYHIWRMVWDYDHMELWCDDILVNNINLDTTNNDKYTAGDIDDGDGCNPFRDVRHMMWLNLALGGNNGGSLANTPRPLYYLIDYARVYQKVGTDGLATYHVDDTVSEPSFALKDGESAGIDNVTLDTEMPAEVSGVYNLQGIRVADSIEAIPATTGRQVYIVTGGGRSAKIVR